jgi:hypothetical protein
MKIPEQPIIIGDEAIQLAIPLFGQARIELFHKW